MKKIQKYLIILVSLIVPITLVSCGNKELSEKKILEELKGKVISISYLDSYTQYNKGDMSLIIDDAREIEITERYTLTKSGTDQVEANITVVNSGCIVKFPVSIFLQRYDDGWKINTVIAGVEYSDSLMFLGITDTSKEGVRKFLEEHFSYYSIHGEVNSITFKDNEMIINAPFTYNYDNSMFNSLKVDVNFDDEGNLSINGDSNS